MKTAPQNHSGFTDLQSVYKKGKFYFQINGPKTYMLKSLQSKMFICQKKKKKKKDCKCIIQSFQIINKLTCKAFQTQAASTECASAFKHEAYSHDKVNSSRFISFLFVSYRHILQEQGNGVISKCCVKTQFLELLLNEKKHRNND